MINFLFGSGEVVVSHQRSQHVAQEDLVIWGEVHLGSAPYISVAKESCACSFSVINRQNTSRRRVRQFRFCRLPSFRPLLIRGGKPLTLPAARGPSLSRNGRGNAAPSPCLSTALFRRSTPALCCRPTILGRTPPR